MCTVTFVPINDRDFVLTSNRDEAPSRETFSPAIYSIQNTKVLFPKDKNAGGTWIGVSEKNRLICVLNGGFGRHKRQEKYRMSRGLIAKNLMIGDDLLDEIQNLECDGIEPFTMIIVEWENELTCYELVWDEKQKHFNTKPLKPMIWSSSTLFDETMKDQRRSWFKTFRSNSDLTAETLWHFHNYAGAGNLDYGVIMDRGYVKTTSITQIQKIEDNIQMSYSDLMSEITTHNFLSTAQIKE